MTHLRQRWLDWLKGQTTPRVLELGGGKGSHNHADALKANEGAVWVGVDIGGRDGALAYDAHELDKRFPEDHFDGFISTYTLEHLAKPWIFARRLAAICRPGARGYLITHPCAFPIHGHPQDYFRFSREALAVLFEGEGFRVQTEYHHPCRVVPIHNAFPHARDWNFEAECFLTVDALLDKI